MVVSSLGHGLRATLRGLLRAGKPDPSGPRRFLLFLPNLPVAGRVPAGAAVRHRPTHTRRPDRARESRGRVLVAPARRLPPLQLPCQGIAAAAPEVRRQSVRRTRFREPARNRAAILPRPCLRREPRTLPAARAPPRPAPAL